MSDPTIGAESTPQAPDHPLPQIPYYSIEYPGYVRPTSIHLAVSNLGGQSALDSAFKRAASRTETLLELKLRPDQPFAHPVPGDVVPTNNILLKVVKKRRKDRLEDGPIGEYIAEVVGIIPKTARFRSMVDYQYQPDMNDSVSKLRVAMDEMDVDALESYVIPDEKADYTVPFESSFGTDMDVDVNLDPQLTGVPELEQPENTAPAVRSNLRLFPPPLFSRQTIPQAYKWIRFVIVFTLHLMSISSSFKSNTASMVSTSVDEDTGEEKKRLINRMRWKGYGPASIMFADAIVGSLFDVRTGWIIDIMVERDGWYTSHAFERIKTVLRHKFFSLLEGHSATDEECRALLANNEGSAKATIANRSHKLRAGKHNMAKGALRPEDAAAVRLRATLDRNAKSLQGSR
ncbi:hypothetical protein H0H87_001191 [Tephrocybe sp. NHM501043]|nr:hypothetical protein H0H87_001191 [Tephrocybe sp. NHM501043]